MDLSRLSPEDRRRVVLPHMEDGEVRQMWEKFKSDGGLLLPVADTGRMVEVKWGVLGGMMIIRANRPSDIGRVDPLKVWGGEDLDNLQLHTDHDGGYYGEAHTPDEGEWRELFTYLTSQHPLLTGGGHLLICQDQSQTSRWDPLLVVLPGVLTHLMSCGVRFVWLYYGSVRGNAIMRMVDDIKEGGWEVESGVAGAFINKPGEGGGGMGIRLRSMTITGSKSDLDPLKALNDQIPILYDPTWRVTDDFDTPPPGKPARDEPQIDVDKMQRDFNKALAEGETETCRGRLVLIGRAGAGKTSAKNALLGLKFPLQHDVTELLEIQYATVSDDGHWLPLDETEMTHHENHYIVAQAIMEKQETVTIAAKTEHLPTTESQSAGFQATQTEREGNETIKVKPHATSESQSTGKLQSGTQEPQSTKSQTGGKGTTAKPISTEANVTPQRKLPPEVQSLLASGKELEKRHTMHVWDFAGQLVYYTVHQLFITEKTAFVLVVDPTNGLDSPIPQEFTEEYDSWLSTETTPKTEREFIEYFLRGVNIWCKSEGGDSAHPAPCLPPHIFILINKADLMTPEAMDEVIKSIEKLLRGTPAFRNMVRAIIPFTSNPDSGRGGNPRCTTYEDSCNTLKQCLAKVMPDFQVKVPIKWLQFRNRLQEETFRTLKEATQLAQEFEVKQDEVTSVLQYFHQHRELVYWNTENMRDFIICQPNWLIQEIKKIITIKKNQSAPRDATAEFSMLYERLRSEKILNMKLAEELWKDKYHVITEILQKYLLLLTWLNDDYGRQQFIVPCLLEPMEDIDPYGQKSDIPPIYFYLTDKVMPIGLTSRLVTWLATEPGWRDGGDVAVVCFNGGKFIIEEEEVLLDIGLKEIVWKPKNTDMDRPTDHTNQVVIQVQAQLMGQLNEEEMAKVPLCLDRVRVSIENGIKSILSMINISQPLETAAESKCQHRLLHLEAGCKRQACNVCRRGFNMESYKCWFGMDVSRNDGNKPHEFVLDEEFLESSMKKIKPTLLKVIQVKEELVAELESHDLLDLQTKQELKMALWPNTKKADILVDFIQLDTKQRFLPLLLSLEATKQYRILRELDLPDIRTCLNLTSRATSLLDNVKQIKQGRAKTASSSLRANGQICQSPIAGACNSKPEMCSTGTQTPSLSTQEQESGRANNSKPMMCSTGTQTPSLSKESGCPIAGANNSKPIMCSTGTQTPSLSTQVLESGLPIASKFQQGVLEKSQIKQNTSSIRIHLEKVEKKCMEYVNVNRELQSILQTKGGIDDSVRMTIESKPTNSEKVNELISHVKLDVESRLNPFIKALQEVNQKKAARAITEGLELDREGMVVICKDKS